MVSFTANEQLCQQHWPARAQAAADSLRSVVAYHTVSNYFLATRGPTATSAPKQSATRLRARACIASLHRNRAYAWLRQPFSRLRRVFACGSEASARTDSSKAVRLVSTRFVFRWSLLIQWAAQSDAHCLGSLFRILCTPSRVLFLQGMRLLEPLQLRYGSLTAVVYGVRVLRLQF